MKPRNGTPGHTSRPNNVRTEDLPLQKTFAAGKGPDPLFSTTIVEATAGVGQRIEKRRDAASSRHEVVPPKISRAALRERVDRREERGERREERGERRTHGRPREDRLKTYPTTPLPQGEKASARRCFGPTRAM